MPYYDALIEKWPNVSGETTGEKLANLNAELVPSEEKQDVKVSSVAGKLMLSGKFARVAQFAQGTPSGDELHDGALQGAQLLMTLIQLPNAPDFNTADPTVYAQVAAMIGAMRAYEEQNPDTTGVTQELHDALLGLAEKPEVPWWKANGYSSSFSTNDLDAAQIEYTPDPVDEEEIEQ